MLGVAQARRIEALRQGWASAEERVAPHESAITVSTPGIVAWRIHIHSIAVQSVPTTHEGTVWTGLYLRITAVWSHENRRTQVFAVGLPGHRWDSEQLTLALPNVRGKPSSGQHAPVAELRVQLCATVAGGFDAVVGTGNITLAELRGDMSGLELRAPELRGQTAMASFSYYIDGMTREQAEQEWDEEDVPASEPAPAPAVAVTARMGRAVPSARSPARSPTRSPTGRAAGPRKTAWAASPPKGEKPRLAFNSTVPSTLANRRAPGVPPPRSAPQLSVSEEASSKRMLARPASAPSARLLMQLEECSRIKQAFARLGMTCPVVAIERGLLLPEDR